MRYGGRDRSVLFGLGVYRQIYPNRNSVVYVALCPPHLSKAYYYVPILITDKSTIDEVKNLRIGINDFEVKDVIGRGHFGEVQVVREKASGDVYAMKVLHKDGTLSKENVSIG